MNRTIVPQLSAGRRQRVAFRPIRELAAPYVVRVFIFLLLHVPLALLMHRVSMIATLHALATFGIGLWWALSGRSLERVAYAGAYITAAEVLWRMSEARVFWEFGKFATVAIFIVAMLRMRRLGGGALPFLYSLLLIPSTVIVFYHAGLWGAKGLLSFNLSGPVALLISAWFFSHLRLSMAHIQRLLLAIIGPVVGITSIAVFTTLTADSLITFAESEASFVTSGGFGPNQVSSVLGLGALLASIYFLIERKSQIIRVLMFVVMIGLASQSALTFSRSGLFLAAGGGVLAAFYLLRDPRLRIMLILVTSLLFVVTTQFLLPRLETFTAGAILRRFQDLDSTYREQIIWADLQIWDQNPVLGVGPGRAKAMRGELIFRSRSAHTEYTRLLAEHGIFGLVAVILLFVMAVRNLRRARTSLGKALVASMTGFSLLFILINGMRLDVVIRSGNQKG